MPNTLNWEIYYPPGNILPSVPTVMQAQAESVEAALDDVETSIASRLNALENSLTVTGAEYYPAVSGGSNFTTTISFPAGTSFSVPPIIMTASSEVRVVIAVKDITTTGCTLQGFNSTSTGSGAGYIYWHALPTA